MRRSVWAAVLLLSGCATFTGGWQDDAPTGYVSGDRSVTTWEEAARPGPVELRGVDFQGSPVDVSQWRGEVVLLNTWYAACPPCRAEAPDLVALAAEYPDVHLLGINSTDDVETALAFERTFAVPYPSLHDSGGAGVAALQGVVPVQAVPTTVLLDRQGRVAARILGRLDPTTIRTLIDELVEAD